MKKTYLLITATLTLGILLSACVPASPQEPTAINPSQTYPVGEDPSQPYPGSEEPTEPISQETNLVGAAAYITDPSVSDDHLEDHAEDINEFAVDLYRQLAKTEGNLIFSPYSVFQAFLMVYAGADAETKIEIADALDIDLDDGDAVHQWMNGLNKRLTELPDFLNEDDQPLVFNVANTLWAQKDYHFEQAFLDKLSANYNAGLKLVDFSDPEAARQMINLWVAAQTNDKIKDLIPRGMLDEMTRMVITNAVYFKGAWQHRFDEQDTQKAPFYLLDGSQAEVDMMSNHFNGMALVDASLSAVRLPYEGGNYAMALIMPADFEGFESNLDEDALEDILERLTGMYASVNLEMPRFTTESSFSLSEQLQALGLEQAFDPSRADFSAMTGQKDLYISDAIHKAFIDVNEEGTEAAAATAIGMSTTSMPTESYDINLDRPFIYVIYEQTTNTIVFMGRFVAP